MHPCQTCGACCAHFRVSFYWREGEPREHSAAVPREMWEEEPNASGLYRTMKGTNAKHHPKCVALRGVIGKNVGCSIYSLRSSTCRKFTASFENGTRNLRCDEARAAHGLAPLNKEDWKSYRLRKRLQIVSREDSNLEE